jgi:enoyl-CoA hydratase
MVHWTIEDGIAIAVIDRPKVHNALDIATVEVLLERFAAVDGPCPPVVLGGAGRTFCAGFDLTTSDDGATFKARVDVLFDAVLAYPAPVVAALNGPAIGMGCVLATVCDLRIGCERSWLDIPAARMRVVFNQTYVTRIRDRLGMAAAQMLLVGSRRIDAARAFELGALHALAEDPLAEATAWAAHTTAFSAASAAGHKAFLNGAGSV